MSRLKSIFALAVTLLFIMVMSTACHVYSFTGASTSAKTITIEYFNSKAQNAPVKASQLFTESLKTKFVNEGNLKQVNADGELRISGYISNYTLTSKSPQAGETSAQVQMTLTVHVDYVNSLDEKDHWSQDFSRYAFYESTANLSAIEDAKLGEINTQLVEDIFNKALVKW
jgi:Lipopolysaccharide-assembly